MIWAELLFCHKLVLLRAELGPLDPNRAGLTGTLAWFLVSHSICRDVKPTDTEQAVCEF